MNYDNKEEEMAKFIQVLKELGDSIVQLDNKNNKLLNKLKMKNICEGNHHILFHEN